MVVCAYVWASAALYAAVANAMLENGSPASIAAQVVGDELHASQTIWHWQWHWQLFHTVGSCVVLCGYMYVQRCDWAESLTE
jgi:hypothetical protein